MKLYYCLLRQDGSDRAQAIERSVNKLLWCTIRLSRLLRVDILYYAMHDELKNERGGGGSEGEIEGGRGDRERERGGEREGDNSVVSIVGLRGVCDTMRQLMFRKNIIYLIFHIGPNNKTNTNQKVTLLYNTHSYLGHQSPIKRLLIAVILCHLHQW